MLDKVMRPLVYLIRGCAALTPQIAVSNGISFLFHHKPDWLDEIDILRLNIASMDDCVLGQLFGSYEIGLKLVGPLLAVLCGFTPGHAITGCLYPTEELEAEWRNRIRELRNAGFGDRGRATELPFSEG